MTQTTKKPLSKREAKKDAQATSFDPSKPNRFTWGPDELQILTTTEPLPDKKDERDSKLNEK